MPGVGYDMRYRVMFRDSFRCTYCGRSAADHGAILEVDHMIPQSAGGETTIMNLVTACQECNAGKGDSTLPEEDIARIIASRREQPNYSSRRYGEDDMRVVESMRMEGFGYKAIARELGISRDSARDLVKRVEKKAAA